MAVQGKESYLPTSPLPEAAVKKEALQPQPCQPAISSAELEMRLLKGQKDTTPIKAQMLDYMQVLRGMVAVAR